ncbi:MAG: helix-turn-helix domain-containing protein [Aridibacter sp.]|jgi:transcriptional regulator with XRE-family HTH domain
MQKDLEILGEHIKNHRTRLGLTQEQFAEKCGFDRTYISLLERGKRNLSFTNLCKVAEGLEISASELIKDI